jgi:hypothetical protein
LIDFGCLVVSGANQVDPDLVDAYYKDLLLQFWRFNPQVIPLNLLDTVYQSAIASLLVFKERRVLQVLPPHCPALSSIALAAGPGLIQPIHRGSSRSGRRSIRCFRP